MRSKRVRQLVRVGREPRGQVLAVHHVEPARRAGHRHVQVAGPAGEHLGRLDEHDDVELQPLGLDGVEDGDPRVEGVGPRGGQVAPQLLVAGEGGAHLAAATGAGEHRDAPGADAVGAVEPLELGPDDVDHDRAAGPPRRVTASASGRSRAARTG